ncbi:MAG: glycosyltransferase [Fibrobacteria bacterium]
MLVCPLDWGLGHASRCVPLIRALLANGHQVRIGAAGGGLRLLRQEFPDLDAFEFPGYPVRYSRSPAFFLPVLLWQLPRMLLGMAAESRELRRILADQPSDLVISDGRYGVFTPDVPSLFITHQIFLRTPSGFPGSAWLARAVLALNLKALRKFSRVWVPDFPGSDSLSGALSHNPCNLENLEFIRPLARFSPQGTGASAEAPESRLHVDVLAVTSGPEPQRGLFEAALRRELARLPGTRILIRGLPPVSSAAGEGPGLAAIRNGGLTVFDHLAGSDLSRLFACADLTVVRSGYTTVMELAGLGAKAVVLVPTPGQPEQEYLAHHLEMLGAGIRMDQRSLSIADARERLQGKTGFTRWRGGERKDGAGEPFSLERFLEAHPLLTKSVRKARQL